MAVRLDPGGNGALDLIYSTFLGGTGEDRGQGIAVNPSGEAVVVGKTTSSNYPVTLDANQSAYVSGYEGFVSLLSPTGAALNYSTYIGGSGSDSVWGVCAPTRTDFYVTGEATSTTIPTTAGAVSTTNPGSTSGIALRFGDLSVNTTLNLTDGGTPVSTVYARLRPYTFTVDVFDSVSLTDVTAVRLVLDPGGSDIRMRWSRVTDSFQEVLDPLDLVRLEPSSYSQNDGDRNWTVMFNVTFDWTYPDENLTYVSIRMISGLVGTFDSGESDVYQVENDLDFDGDLSVTGPAGPLSDGDLVGPESSLVWTGLTVVYEGTTNVHPPKEEYNVSIWNEEGSTWPSSPDSGEAIDMGTLAPNSSDVDGDTHVVNITDVPYFCDISDVSFTLFIDDANITFRDAFPPDNEWQTTDEVTIGITIDDVGGGMVNGDLVLVRTSADNGTTWGSWNTYTQPTLETVEAEAVVQLQEGRDNLVQWSAIDTLGNGPDLSPAHRVIVDTTGPVFFDIHPTATDISYEEMVVAYVNVTDELSGVDPYSIEYSLSEDAGVTWDDWEEPEWKEYGNVVRAAENIVPPNGTANRIRWRALDYAGNEGISDPQPVNVNLWVQTALRTVLSTPDDEALLTEASGRLEWSLRIPGLTGVSYDVYLDTVNPPQTLFAVVHDSPWMAMPNLLDKTTYHWTVIPHYEGLTGTCDSGVWSFTYDKDFIVPGGWLDSPSNGATVTGKSVDLAWKPEGDGAGWAWDVYLDDVDPPVDRIETKTMDLTTTVDDLADNVTYYWTAVPSKGPYPGVCLSGVWSFTFRDELEVPRVTLLSPEDGGAVTADPQTLTWEPLTEGTGEGWTYDVWFGEGADPADLVADGIPDTEYGVEDLVVGTMYSWTVVPTSAEGVEGVKGRVVWSFNVTTGRPEDFGVEVGPIADITLVPGGATQFVVNVTNTGVVGDNIGSTLDTGLLGTQLGLQSQSVSGVGPGEGAQVMVTVSILPGTGAGDYSVTFTGRSLNADDMGFDVTDSVTFTVTVTVVETATPPKEDETDNTMVWVALIIAILAVVAILAMVIVMRRRRKREERDKREEEEEALKADIITPGGPTRRRATPVVAAGGPVPRGGVGPGPLVAESLPPEDGLTTSTAAPGSMLGGGAGVKPTMLLPKAGGTTRPAPPAPDGAGSPAKPEGPPAVPGGGPPPQAGGGPPPPPPPSGATPFRKTSPVDLAYSKPDAAPFMAGPADSASNKAEVYHQDSGAVWTPEMGESRAAKEAESAVGMLAKLNKLREKGAISEEEYEESKRRLLRKI